MYHKIIKTALLIFSCLTVAACTTSFFDRDNTAPPTPLTTFTPEVSPIRLWSTQAGPGFRREYIKVSPSVGRNAVFTTSYRGVITAVAKANGAILWQTNTQLPLSTSAGIGDGLVAAGSRKGDVVALDEFSGQVIWQTHILGEILAKPAVSNNLVVVKSTDGIVRALSARSGKEMWSFQQAEPNLILRGASDPIIQDSQLFVGFANGSLGKYALKDGQMLWLTPVADPAGAFAVQRMIDIDANPIVYQHNIYAGTYQGRIAKLGWRSGKIHWSHEISTYTGMTADDNTVYVSDASGYVWAFTADGGYVTWRQTHLANRRVTGPATQGPYVVVADLEGYLHWLGKNDGHFAARVKQSSPYYAAPVAENGVLYAFSNSGNLAAYVLG